MFLKDDCTEIKRYATTSNRQSPEQYVDEGQESGKLDGGFVEPGKDSAMQRICVLNSVYLAYLSLPRKTSISRIEIFCVHLLYFFGRVGTIILTDLANWCKVTGCSLCSSTS